jgi:hypothetical protein
MLGLSPWVSLLAVLAAAVIARGAPARGAAAVRRMLDSRAAPLAVGTIGGLLTLWLWGSLRQTPVMHDESAYLLQAELFARLHWAGSGHALPQFFEQLYVLVDSVTASKYPPGNSLVLATGVIVGLPGLPVVVMNGVSCGLLFVLARRYAGSIVALLTCMVWLSSFPILYYHANYMSEGTTSVTWLLTWWGITRWRDGHGRGWLVAAATAAAWCTITRPLTGAALSAVALAVAVRRCRAMGRWRDLGPPVAAAAFVLALMPLWSWATTGDPRVTPLAVYTNTYVPFDHPGFGARPQDAPAARLPRDQRITSSAFYREHARHTPAALPSIIGERLAMLDRDLWYEWRGGLRVFAVIALFALPLEAWIALAAFGLQFALYLSYAHPAWWTMYYVEGTPVLAFATALGIARFFALATGELGAVSAASLTSALAAARRALTGAPATESTGTVTAAVLIAGAGLIAGGLVAQQVRSKLREDHSYFDAFSRLVDQIPDRRAIVFVRYGDKHPDGVSFVRNVADPEQARVWTVYDRGAENAKLMGMVPDRAVYLFDESNWTLRPVARPPLPNGAAVAAAGGDAATGRRAGRRPR